MSQNARNTVFLAQRLREMGLNLGPDSQQSSAQGELPLSSTPFETLEGSFRSESARFYTLGHNRLKFFYPSPFFHVPAVDVSRCESVSQIESALRRSWALRLRQLQSAREWLQRCVAARWSSGRRDTAQDDVRRVGVDDACNLRSGFIKFSV